jgi:hypothetical protein
MVWCRGVGDVRGCGVTCEAGMQVRDDGIAVSQS